ncbi:MAG: tetratricopeptide repeat protein, partial [Alphaproteobacteria bacterium]|nr:tetratricopeptide repeat protein [Alphaproteobacteria bacterium]
METPPTEPDVDSIVNAALALHGEGRLEHAALVWREVLRRDPSRWLAWSRLGLLEKELAPALDLFRRAAMLAPERGEVWIDLGQALRRHGQPAQAALAYRRAISLAPGEARAHAELGRAER